MQKLTLTYSFIKRMLLFLHIIDPKHKIYLAVSGQDLVSRVLPPGERVPREGVEISVEWGLLRNVGRRRLRVKWNRLIARVDFALLARCPREEQY